MVFGARRLATQSAVRGRGCGVGLVRSSGSCGFARREEERPGFQHSHPLRATPDDPHSKNACVERDDVIGDHTHHHFIADYLHFWQPTCLSLRTAVWASALRCAGLARAPTGAREQAKNLHYIYAMSFGLHTLPLHLGS